VSGVIDQHPALLEFRARTRRSRRIYAASLVVLIALVVALVRLAYAHGDLNNVSRKTGAPPEVLATAKLKTTLNQVWRTDDRPAAGNPYSDGIVVTYDEHTVNGRDAKSGLVRWYYSRSDRTLCSVVQQDRTTIAVYRHDGNCDQVTGFVSATGEPKWYRTLTDNGDTVASSAPNVVLLVAKTTVHVIDNAGGLDRWNWAVPEAGCQVERALAGSQGVLISFHCGNSNRLVLHELTGDKEKWNVTLNFRSVPLTAGSVITALNRDSGELITFSADKGAVVGQTKYLAFAQIEPALVADPPLRSVATTDVSIGEDVELTRLFGELLAVAAPPKGAKAVVIAWRVPTDAQPAVLTDVRIATVDADRVTLVTGVDGKPSGAVTLQPTPTAFGESHTRGLFAVRDGLLLTGDHVEMYL